MSSTITARTAAAPTRERLAGLLRRASSRSGLVSLLRRLGLDHPLLPIALPAADVLAHASVGTPRVFLLQLAGAAGAERVHELARALQAAADGPFLVAAATPRFRTLALGCLAPDGELRLALVERLQPRAADLLLLEELAVPESTALGKLLRWARVLDRTGIGARFFRDMRAQRDAISRAWTGLPARARADRDQLSLLLLSRLLFICFLQERGHLLGDREYLARRVREWRAAGERGLYAAVIRPLCFGVFNTRPARRDPPARALGDLPYLNGGLFEPHALERRHAALDLSDDVLLHTCTTVLQRYRFTSRDAADRAASGELDAGIDPEVLGRVFESLMATQQRGESGSFYTPPEIVDALVTRTLECTLGARCGLALDAAARLVRSGDVAAAADSRDTAIRVLRELRVLDPACGSGAFLLGALTRIASMRAALEPDTPRAALRQDVVARTLHGVDLLDNAALLCSLRLWLALAPGEGEAVTPLPNLDRRIRQGDALIDPLDLIATGARAGAQRGAALAADVRRTLRTLQPLGQAYVSAEPAERAVLLPRLRETEAALARSWLTALRLRLAYALRESAASLAYRDLWGEPAVGSAGHARVRQRLQQRLEETDTLLRQLAENRSLPFFSFLVHFAAEQPGFDLIITNPPWIRAHRWPDAIAGAVRERFRVCREAGWRSPLATGGVASASGQVDMALLFLERALGLLRDGGILGMLLPAKLARSLYAGGARALLAEHAVLELDDHSLDQNSIFEADAFTVAIVAQKRAAAAGTTVRITMRNRGRDALHFELPQHELPLLPGDASAPWLIAPPQVSAVLRRMQQHGTPLGQRWRLRRGVITGANDVLITTDAQHKLGGLSRIRAQGYFRARRDGRRDAARYTAWLETECLRPLLRGGDVKAWRWSTPQRIVWDPVNDGAGTALPRTLAYLARHADELRHRTGTASGAALGKLMRTHPDLLGCKVVWQDIADDLHAAAIPARVTGDDGRPVPVVPLNTVYYVATADEREAALLSALLNSLPVRTFARTLAERAKDARFRFFAWTVAALPIPGRISARVSSRLVAIAATAHRDRGIGAAAQQELDDLVATAYGLTAADLDRLREFGAWLHR